jgi:hypothetical protein
MDDYSGKASGKATGPATFQPDAAKSSKSKSCWDGLKGDNST